MNLLSALKKPHAKPSTTNHFAHAHLATEETPLTPTLVVTKLNVKPVLTVLPIWPVMSTSNDASIPVEEPPVEKDPVELKITNLFATAHQDSNQPMVNVWTLMNVPSQDHAMPQPFAEIHLVLSPALALKVVWEMPEPLVANPGMNVLGTGIAR